MAATRSNRVSMMAGALLTLFSSVAVAAAPERADPMTAIADDFVRVGLLFQNHDPSPCLFFGPEALRSEARRQQVALPDVVTQLVALRARIEALPATATPDEQRRRRDLAQRITATVARGGILMGVLPAGFDEEVRLIFDVQVPRYDEAHFRAVTAKLDSITPGDGDLVARVEVFREQFVIPPERLEHVHATLVDQEMVGRRGWNEYTLITLLGPLAVVAEGAANFGVDLAFSRQERMDFDRNVPMPLAGLDGRQLETDYHYIDLLDQLNFARIEVARKYLYQGFSREQAVQWLMELGLESRATAEQRLDFIDTQRAYVIKYD